MTFCNKKLAGLCIQRPLIKTVVRYVQLAAGTRFIGRCRCGEVFVVERLTPSRHSLSLNFSLYRLYYSLSKGNLQEALEDLHRVEEITGKSKSSF